MTTMIVEKEQVPALLDQWLKRTGDEATKIEVVLSSGQMVISELSDKEEELDRWLDDYLARRDNLMQRLADA